MSKLEELAAKLGDPNTSYFGRIDAVRGLGDLKASAAVPLLVKALDDNEQMVRQSAVKALASIGTPETIAPLMKVLDADDDSLHHYAAEALGDVGATQARQRLEHLQEHGSFMARSAARRALEKLPAASAPPAAAPAPNTPQPSAQAAPPAGTAAPPPLPGSGATPAKNVDPTQIARLLQQAIQGFDCHITPEHNGARYKLEIKLQGGRHQDVYVASGVSDSEGAPLLCVYTYCGPAVAENYERALRYNMRMSYGALAINDVNGEAMFVMVETVLISAVNVDEMRKTIAGLARHGDRVEKALTGKDTY